MTASRGKPGKRLLRISELSALTDIPPASIKFYIREGLLPPPIKTSRNMAYYDESFVEKIRLIKKLQGRHFLPLRVIREILTASDGEAELAEAQALLELKATLLQGPIGERREPLPEPEVIRQLNTYEEELEKLRKMGIVNPTLVDGQRVYGGDDLDFLAALEHNRRLGFTREIGFQVDDLAIYLTLLEALAKEEVNLLISRTASRVSIERIRQLAERGIREFSPLLMVLRRKMILKVLAGLEPGASAKKARDGKDGRGRARGNGRHAPGRRTSAPATPVAEEDEPEAGGRGLT